MKKYITFLITSATLFFSCRNNSGANPEDLKLNEQNLTEKTEVVINHAFKDTSNISNKMDSDKIKTESTAEKLFKEIEKGKVKVLFHGSGTEPWWDLYLTEDKLLFVNSNDNIKESFSLKTKFDKNLKSQTINYINSEGENVKIIILKEPRQDDMSEKIHQYTISWPDAPQMTGAGDAK